METFVDFPDLGSVEKELENYLREEALKGMNTVAPRIRTQVRELVDVALRLSPEWDSLLGGTLREHFGIADPVPVLAGIARVLQESVLVEVFVGQGQSLGAMKVSVGRDNYADVLAVPGASYTSNDSVVDWLNWLLLAGDKLVLGGLIQLRQFKRSRRGSRTGRTIMIERNPNRRLPRGVKPSPIVPWQVPPEFAGDESSNWLTRTLEPLVPSVEDIVLAEMQRI